MVEIDIFVPPEVTSVIDTIEVKSTMTTLSYPLFSEPLEFLTMTH